MAGVQVIKQEAPLLRRAQRVRRASLVYFMTFIRRQTTYQQLINHLYATGHMKRTEFREITQNNGHYNVQGRSRSAISVPIESPYATSY